MTEEVQNDKKNVQHDKMPGTTQEGMMRLYSLLFLRKSLGESPVIFLNTR